MSLSSPGFSLFAQLVPEKKKIKINVCIICQSHIDVKGSTKLTSVPDITEITRLIFHVKRCYAKTRGRGQGVRGKITETPTPNKRETSTKSAPFSPTSRLKRVKTTVNVREKPCISFHLNVRGTLKDSVLVK